MFIDIYDIGDRRVTFDGEVDPGDLTEGGPEPIRVHAARLAGFAERGDRGIDLRARLDARVELQCGRCLEPYTLALAVNVVLILVAATPEGGPAPAEVTDEDAALFQVEGPRADLRLVAREQILLQVPLKLTCSDDCRGLCPTCGANRNRIECGCRPEAGDPRLAPLMELRKRMGDS